MKRFLPFLAFVPLMLMSMRCDDYQDEYICRFRNASADTLHVDFKITTTGSRTRDFDDVPDKGSGHLLYVLPGETRDVVVSTSIYQPDLRELIIRCTVYDYTVPTGIREDVLESKDVALARFDVRGDELQEQNDIITYPWDTY